jgi:hypothetical protein
MEPGAPEPCARQVGDTLFVAYVCRNPQFPGWDAGESIEHPGFDVYSSVLRFDGVVTYRLGPPSDERLHEHPLYEYGLTQYGFFEVSGLADTPIGARHWVVTFHDEMLAVTALSASVAARRVEGENTNMIVAHAA